MNVLFLGLGLMGSRMARNLLAAGHAVTVWNRTRDKSEALAQAGARVVDVPADIDGSTEVMMTMLSAPDAVAEVATGEDGFLQAAPEGSVWVDFSTVNPSFSRTMAAFAHARGIRFVDAPVAGTTGPAASGELTVFAGGEADDVAMVQPLFDAIGKKTIHVGPVGLGASLKMVTNLMLGQSMVAFSEAVHFGEAMGLSRKLLFDTLIGGPVAAPFLQGKRAKLEEGDYAPEFPLEHMHKDLHLANSTASEVGVPMLSAATAEQLFQVGRMLGLARQDFSAMFRALGDMGGGE